MAAIGQQLAMLHDGGLVHGDLTTSNMLLREADKKLVGAVGGPDWAPRRTQTACG